MNKQKKWKRGGEETQYPVINGVRLRVNGGMVGGEKIEVKVGDDML